MVTSGLKGGFDFRVRASYPPVRLLGNPLYWFDKRLHKTRDTCDGSRVGRIEESMPSNLDTVLRTLSPGRTHPHLPLVSLMGEIGENWDVWGLRDYDWHWIRRKVFAVGFGRRRSK